MKQIFGKSNVISKSIKEETSSDQQDVESIRERLRKSVQSLQRDRKVVETKKFAGQSVQ